MLIGFFKLILYILKMCQWDQSAPDAVNLPIVFWQWGHTWTSALGVFVCMCSSIRFSLCVIEYDMQSWGFISENLSPLCDKSVCYN